MIITAKCWRSSRRLGIAAAECSTLLWLLVSFFFFETYCYFIILFGGIDMAFMKFVIKTLVVAKHNLLAGLFACALLFFFPEPSGWWKVLGPTWDERNPANPTAMMMMMMMMMMTMMMMMMMTMMMLMMMMMMMMLLLVVSMWTVFVEFLSQGWMTHCHASIAKKRWTQARTKKQFTRGDWLMKVPC